VGANSETGIKKENAAISPWCEETAFIGGSDKIRVVFFERDEDIFKGGGCGCRWIDREAEAVGLVGSMVGILAYDYCFDCIERSVV